MICKAKDQVKEVDAQVIDQKEEEDDQLFMITSSESKESTYSLLNANIYKERRKNITQLNALY